MCNEETEKSDIRIIGRFVVIPVPEGDHAAIEVCNQPVESNSEDDTKPTSDESTEHSDENTEHSDGTPALRNCRTFCWKLLRCPLAALIVLAYVALLVLLWCPSCTKYNNNFRGTFQFVVTLIAPIVAYLVYICCARRRDDEDE